MDKFFANNKKLIIIAGVLVMAGIVALFVFFGRKEFKSVNGKIQFSRGGSVYTNRWFEVEGDRYHAGVDGYLDVGFASISGSGYYFDDTGRMLTGLILTDDGYRYFGKDGKMLTGEIELNKQIHFFGQDGVAAHDWVDVNGVLKFFDREGVQCTGIVKSTDGKVYFARSEGGFETGKKEIDGKLYVFGSDGAAKTGFIDEGDGAKYFACDDGYAPKGWFAFNDGSKGYAEILGVPLVSTVKDIEGKKYYFNSTGRCVIGRFEFDDGSKGYSDVDGAMCTGYTQIGDAEFLLDEDGKAISGINERGGKLYFSDDYGLIVKDGYIRRDGRMYYLDEEGVVQTGWITLKDGKKAFATDEGYICISTNATIDGVPYYFDENGDFGGEGWVNIGEDGGKGYVKGQGVLAVGKNKIGGNNYYFAKDGLMQTDWITDGEQEMYAQEDGVLATGEMRIGFFNCKFDSEGLLMEKKAIADKMVAITYDDGPSFMTPKILDAVEATGAHVTFFVVGNRLSEYSEFVKRADSLGCEIASHTYEHKTLTKMDPAGMLYQINKTNEVLEGIIGKKCTLVRPPGGSVDEAVLTTLGEYPMILWNIDTEDWHNRDTEITTKKALESVEDGDIILMHDLYESTADAALNIFTELQNRGFLLVTVSELADAKGGMVGGKKYFSF